MIHAIYYNFLDTKNTLLCTLYGEHLQALRISELKKTLNHSALRWGRGQTNELSVDECKAVHYVPIN